MNQTANHFVQFGYSSLGSSQTLEWSSKEVHYIQYLMSPKLFVLLNTTLIIPLNEGGLIACVWAISEGHTKYLYTVNLVPP